MLRVYEIQGTGDRNNPLRRQLETPFRGNQLFVRFRMRYRAGSVDQPDRGNGEFFILWLDETDGGDRAPHNGGVPNLGVHVADGQNRFMVRFGSSKEVFAPQELKGDQEYRIVARLVKLETGATQPFAQLDLWVDPEVDDFDRPDATITTENAISRIAWLGFATGRKTERSDRIFVSDVGLALTWEEVYGIPPEQPPPPSPSPEVTQQSKTTVSFADDVLPIFKSRCFACHRGADAESGVRLDVLDETLNQVTPGNSDTSRLIQVVSSKDIGLRMPPPDSEQALTTSEIQTLSTWIEEGVEWDEKALPTATRQTSHWAFQPIERPSVPEVKNREWVRTPVDAFVARQHERFGLIPAVPADVETLRRRLSLDLLGLPPAAVEAPAQPDSAESKSGKATSASASTEPVIQEPVIQDPVIQDALIMDAFIEELLASPHYGERWGRHWLDVARWAETNGHQHNRPRPHAWRYRDYVIESFNRNRPYNEFLTQQLAGDELPYSDENLIATGFLSAARYSGNELDKEIQRNDILVDVVNTTATAFLGLTLECAQCHSHKFDPISLRDYYRLQACFAQGQPGNVILVPDAQTPARLVDYRWRIFDHVRSRLEASRRARGYPEPVLVIPKSVVSGMTASERAMFDQLERRIGEWPQVWGWYSPVTAATALVVAPHVMRWPLPRRPEELENLRTHMLLRGDVQSPGPAVSPGWPAVFGPTPGDLAQPRRALAEWMLSSENPLTARVWVNRIWQWHFGQGLVDTSGDFGTQGTPPSHPELVDWLASELIASGWDTKHIHRLILHSNTYRQSSDVHAANQQSDPDNRFLWRWTPRRLEAEAIRDSVLAVAGRIDLTVGGPSVPPDAAGESCRRSIYQFQKRDALPLSQTLFDAPDGVRSCSRRRVATVPQQSLYLLNSRFMQDMSAAFAERIRSRSGTLDEQIEQAFVLAFGRAIGEDELQRSRDFLRRDSLEAFCLVLLNTNEFVYLP